MIMPLVASPFVESDTILVKEDLINRRSYVGAIWRTCRGQIGGAVEGRLADGSCINPERS